MFLNFLFGSKKRNALTLFYQHHLGILESKSLRQNLKTMRDLSMIDIRIKLIV